MFTACDPSVLDRAVSDRPFFQRMSLNDSRCIAVEIELLVCEFLFGYSSLFGFGNPPSINVVFLAVPKNAVLFLHCPNIAFHS